MNKTQTRQPTRQGSKMISAIGNVTNRATNAVTQLGTNQVRTRQIAPTRSQVQPQVQMTRMPTVLQQQPVANRTVVNQVNNQAVVPTTTATPTISGSIEAVPQTSRPLSTQVRQQATSQGIGAVPTTWNTRFGINTDPIAMMSSQEQRQQALLNKLGTDVPDDVKANIEAMKESYEIQAANMLQSNRTSQRGITGVGKIINNVLGGFMGMFRSKNKTIVPQQYKVQIPGETQRIVTQAQPTVRTEEDEQRQILASLMQ